jgi:D-alanyl-D-alanine carboxypeptidase
MRVLEPHHFKHLREQRRQQRRNKRYALIPALLCFMIIGYVLVGQDLIKKADIKSETGSNNQQTNADTVEEKPTTLKQLSSEQFKALYSSFVYPNTQPITEEPEITGYPEADKRIRAVAIRRGYKLTALPVASIVKTGEPGLDGDDLIQPNALMSWQDLKSAAAAENIPLQLTSAYRSIEYQRALFLRRMQDESVTVYTIVEGYADDELETVLSRAAIPGYSRHHTGYTIDLSCDGVGLEAFVRTSCYAWLSKNNFENTKKFGWVPSYPEGVTNSGPEPEAWEYIWVGTSSLYE